MVGYFKQIKGTIMLKTVRVIACTALVGISLGAMADGHGYNCTANPPAKYPGASFGNNAWGQCYLDSAVIECQNHEMMDPPVGCAAAAVEFQIKLVKNHSLASMGCTKESKEGWLPTGVSESQCETSVLEFSKHCIGADPVSCSA
jgi:hypothetical protein